MGKLKVALVESQAFAVDVASISAAVAIRAKCNQIVVGMLPALCPRDNVVNVSINVSAGGNGAAMAGFHQDLPLKVSRY